MTAIADLGAAALALSIRHKEISPVEAVRAVLDRIDAGTSLNAFITVSGDLAMAAARQAERAVMQDGALPPLHGVPYSVKDLVNTAGVRTTMGSAIFAENVPTEDAVAVARAKVAGAILVGKTTTPEFGHKQLTEAPIFGQTLNPIDPAVTCGASSGGAAVALAAGMGPLALGTDGGGSIRIPAACCGVVGLKATLGTIPHLQVPDLFAANSYVGPMARTVADTALLFGVLTGPDPRDPYGQAALPSKPPPADLAGMRIAWMARCGNRLLDPEVEAVTLVAVRHLEAMGARIEAVEIDFASLEPHFLVILESGVAARVAPYLDAFRDRLDPHLVVTVESGLRHGAVALQQAGAARSAMFRKLQAVFERADLLISPVLSSPPPPLGPQLPDGPVLVAGEPSGPIRGGWYPYTFPLNLTGHPALAMPCGVTRGGLPIGLQIAGPWHADRTILAVAGLLEAVVATTVASQFSAARRSGPIPSRSSPLPSGDSN